MSTVFYTVGQVIELTATFQNNGVNTDPAAVTCIIRAPYTLTETTYTVGSGIAKTGTGVYTLNITPSSGGVWAYRWVGTSPVQTAIEGILNVSPSLF